MPLRVIFQRLLVTTGILMFWWGETDALLTMYWVSVRGGMYNFQIKGGKGHWGPQAADLIITELAQKLHRRLGTILLPGRHVDIIHKEHQLVACRGAILGLALLVQLALHKQLHAHTYECMSWGSG